MWIPLEIMSSKFQLLKDDLSKCKTIEEKKKLLEDAKVNWKYDWIAEEIKNFFKNKQDWKKSK